ncbi:sugar-transfer associated ATP-grasp domain-containing protein [Thalassotalea ganghwensis]
MSLDQLRGFERLKRTLEIIEKEAVRYNRSSLSIMFEMLKLYGKCRFGPNYYLLAGMANPNMSWDEKCSHISDKQYHQALNILNPKPYRKITQHKLTEKAILKLSNIESSNFIGFLQPQKGFDYCGKPLTTEKALSELLSQFLNKKICAKLPEGFGGKGFLAGKIVLDGELRLLPLNDKKSLSIQELVASYEQVIENEGLLFESYIEQSEAYSAFNPTSVNTIRTWVLQTENKIEVIGAYFRIGRQGSLTDNGDGGGVMCPVNPESGVLGSGLLTVNPFRDNLTAHPDTGVQLSGIALDNWQEIVASSCETLRKLPYTRFAGLDVAMSIYGPIIIEINVTPDKDGAAYGFINSNKLVVAATSIMDRKKYA